MLLPQGLEMNFAIYIHKFLLFLNIFLNMVLIRRISHLCKLFFHKISTIKKSSDMSIPRHLAFIIADHTRLNHEFLASLLILSHKNGISEVSLYDPWSYLANNDNKKLLDEFLCNHQMGADLNSQVNNEKRDHKINFKINFAKNGQFLIADACRKMCNNSSPITLTDLSSILNKSNNEEPDLVVKISNVSRGISAFPCWYLRVSEIFELPNTLYTNKLTDGEFKLMISEFCCRNRRFGR